PGKRPMPALQSTHDDPTPDEQTTTSTRSLGMQSVQPDHLERLRRRKRQRKTNTMALSTFLIFCPPTRKEGMQWQTSRTTLKYKTTSSKKSRKQPPSRPSPNSSGTASTPTPKKYA